MKKLLLILLCTFALAGAGYAQAIYQPYSYQFYQKLNSDLYSTDTRLHTSLKPFFIDDTALIVHYNRLMDMGTDSTRRRGWIHRKLFQEHLIDVRKDDEYTFFVDYLPDLTVGRDFKTKQNTWLNTRGYQIGGTIGKKFYFYSSGFENQGTFPDYYSTYVNQTGMVSGQAYDRKFGRERTKDWSYVTALLSYTPVKYVNIALGNDKNFIGDGYRSILLSDFSAPMPFFKVTATLGNVRYMAMWSYMNDPRATQPSYQYGNRRKWGVFHYLDWNVSNRISLGFFDNVIWADMDDQFHKRGFDFAYLNPLQFLRPVEATVGSPDNAYIGFTGKYKITNGITAYGQFGLDEFEAKNFFSTNGSSRNKYAYQIGFRGADLFKVKTLNYLIEYNAAKPYTFQEQTLINNYSNNGEPLAHPFGANFREMVGLLNYSYKRFDFSGELQYSQYGLDKDGRNFGKDIFQLYTQPAKGLGNYTGQGLITNTVYAEGKVAYLLNPKYNLRIELGGVLRREKNDSFNDRTALITIGLRSSFRNLYMDLASYKNHL